MAETTIAWTRGDDGTPGKTWNPVRGCSRVSPGCGDATGGGCYAMNMAHRFSGKGQPYEGLTRIGKRGVDWAGFARLVPEQLGVPLRWRKPRRIFVNSMSDLFHESLTNEEIAAVFGVMAACQEHSFQVLTKRAKRMGEWFEWVDAQDEDPPLTLMLGNAANHLAGERWDERLNSLGLDRSDCEFDPEWPLPNVWLGVSAEDQQRADERIPHLLATPAAVRFVSVEPCLGPVSLLPRERGSPDTERGILNRSAPKLETPRLDWVIVGGESGPRARPFDLAWARSLVGQCKAASVACFVKQIGARPFDSCNPFDEPSDLKLRDRAGADPAEWPEDLRVREFPQ